MFRCERCGSSYSAIHAMAIENCPRCQVRDQVTSQLVFKPFEFPGEAAPKLRSLPLTVASGQAGRDRPGSASQPTPGSLAQSG
jgi:predicted  nucleic acid-binding Zn-ribbon protein